MVSANILGYTQYVQYSTVVRTLNHSLGQGSAVDKPRTPQCQSESLIDITDWNTGPPLCFIIDFMLGLYIVLSYSHMFSKSTPCLSNCHAWLGIQSFAHSLRSLKSIERLWAIRLDRSGQKSNPEQITQVAHDKWATMSDSLRSLMINERMRESLIFSKWISLSLTKRAIRSNKNY